MESVLAKTTPKDLEVNFKNVRYGMLVEVLHDDGYHAGCKVHFFNKKGVLIGNYYEFVPYSKLRLRTPKSRTFPRYFYGKKNEHVKSWLFIGLLNLITKLLKFAEKKID